MLKLATVFFIVASSSMAQHPTFSFVAPTTSGRVTLPPQGGAWEPSEAGLYDDATRPVLQYRDGARDLVLSVLLFPNPGKAGTAEACRNSLIPGLTSALREHGAVLEAESQTLQRASNDLFLAVASYTIAKQGTIPLQQRNVFAFAGDTHTCAEMHISKVKAQASDQHVFDDLVNHFAVDLSYKPLAVDYETMGVIFFEGAKNYAASAVFYQRAYDELNPEERKSRMGRYTADRLTLSYGMAGDLKQSRATAQAAIAVDPAYPLYYYNLACADAESGDAAAAKIHLQQAFERRANTLQGEPFPDPTKDDSLQKLKADKPFWDLATSISAQLKK